MQNPGSRIFWWVKSPILEKSTGLLFYCPSKHYLAFLYWAISLTITLFTTLNKTPFWPNSIFFSLSFSKAD